MKPSIKTIQNKKAIIVGASSGIGEALAKQLSNEGYVLGLIARREELLLDLQKNLPTKSYLQKIDVADLDDSSKQFTDLLEEMDGVDLVIISAGTGFINYELDYSKEIKTIQTNVSGFVVIADLAFNHFAQKKSGHLVGISSILALCGNDAAPAYNASKAFVSNYLQGLRKKSIKENLNITITDIKPGYVDTEMAKGGGMFWVAPVEKAAKQIIDSIKKKKHHAYITKRWRIIGWLLKILPFVMSKKF